MDMIKIQKNGNGHSIMIPAHLMRQLQLNRTDVLACEVVDGKLSYEPLRKHTITGTLAANMRRPAEFNKEAKS